MNQAGSITFVPASMPVFIGTKVIKAIGMSRGDYNMYRGWAAPKGEDQSVPGYLVEYMDGGPANHPDHAGYIGWSPREQFDNAYRLLVGLSFGMALEAMKLGNRVARTGWNGSGQWVCRGEGNPALPAEQFWNSHTHAFALMNGGTAPVLPYFILKTAQGAIMMGWSPSQSDALAEDWEIVI